MAIADCMQRELQADEGAPPRIEKPILQRLGEGWVLYYPLADRLLILNATAKTVWHLLAEGYAEHEIASTFALHFGISSEQAARDVAQVLVELNATGNQQSLGDATAWVTSDTSAPERRMSADCGVFRFGPSRVKILSSVPELDESFFLRFQHRDAGDGDGVDLLEIAQVDSTYRLLFRERLVAEAKTVVALFSRVVELLLCLEHPDTPLMAYCHAAAISRAGRSLLMPGSSGVGKSTLTAFLVANGFAYLADDTVAVGEHAMSLAPLPTCLSIKSGSWAVLEPLYPVLPTLATLSRYGRTLRYVAPHQNYQTLVAAAAPAAIVFPEYKAGEGTQLKPLAPMQTMIRLLGAHARLSAPASEAKLERLIQFVEQTPAYDLTYSELPSAMQAIEGLLDAPQ